MIPASNSPQQVRATQTLIAHMSFCWRHGSLTALEVGWRWLFGIPFLLILEAQAQQILLRIPTDSAGLNHLSFQNPWLSTSLLADAAALYQPAVAQVLDWLVPAGILVWSAVSGLGRTLVLSRMRRLSGQHLTHSSLSRAASVIVLQALWLAAQLAVFYLWYRGVDWAAANHLNSPTDPDLLGYLLWLIFFSLGLFSAWALTSWTLAAAPIVLLDEDCSIPAAIARSFRLGKTLSSKLLEINLVLAIVRIALIVLAMVFSAAPLPFADAFGPGGLNALYVVIAILYLIANDYFQVVRLRSFSALFEMYRCPD
jgi:hypothetical protein